MAHGRPREFDAEVALDKAMEVFWKRGYDGATLPELTAAMGINKPSLYAAFGNKEQLFLKTLDRYTHGPAGYVTRALDQPTARAAVEQLLAGSIELSTNPKNPGGCMVLQAALTCGEASECVRDELASVRAAGQELLRNRLERAKREGELPKETDTADWARFITALIHGLGVQASGGASKTQLQRVVELAMRAWPV